jgi:phosphoribosylformylglycinamidine synthase
MKARVFVTLKPSVFDPQGRTIVEALHSLGYDAVGDVRQGKYFELDLSVPTRGEAEALAAEVADRVLSNPVIESFRLEIEAPDGVGRMSSSERAQRIGGAAGAKPPGKQI